MAPPFHLSYNIDLSFYKAAFPTDSTLRLSSRRSEAEAACSRRLFDFSKTINRDQMRNRKRLQTISPTRSNPGLLADTTTVANRAPLPWPITTHLGNREPQTQSTCAQCRRRCQNGTTGAAARQPANVEDAATEGKEVRKMTAVATGSMDRPRYRPRCAQAQPRSRSEGKQQRGGPATRPTPPEAPGAVSAVFATGSPADGRGPVTVVGSAHGNRDHVTADSAAQEEARSRAASDHDRVRQDEPSDASGFPATRWPRRCGLATER